MPNKAHQVLINPISSFIEATINTIKYRSTILVCLEQGVAFTGIMDFLATPDLQMLIYMMSPDFNIYSSKSNTLGNGSRVLSNR